MHPHTHASHTHMHTHAHTHSPNTHVNTNEIDLLSQKNPKAHHLCICYTLQNAKSG